MLIAGVPTILRTDRGTENCNIAFIHPTLRSQHSDHFAGEKSFRYGRSTSNQVQGTYLKVFLIITQIFLSFRELKHGGPFCVHE